MRRKAGVQVLLSSLREVAAGGKFRAEVCASGARSSSGTGQSADVLSPFERSAAPERSVQRSDPVVSQAPQHVEGDAGERRQLRRVSPSGVGARPLQRLRWHRRTGVTHGSGHDCAPHRGRSRAPPSAS